jgi:hypothetical protein
MSLISNETIKRYAVNRGIKLRGKPNSSEELQHLEELRKQIWREKGFELVNGKWKKQ